MKATQAVENHALSSVPKESAPRVSPTVALDESLAAPCTKPQQKSATTTKTTTVTVPSTKTHHVNVNSDKLAPAIPVHPGPLVWVHVVMESKHAAAQEPTGDARVQLSLSQKSVEIAKITTAIRASMRSVDVVTVTGSSTAQGLSSTTMGCQPRRELRLVPTPSPQPPVIFVINVLPLLRLAPLHRDLSASHVAPAKNTSSRSAQNQAHCKTGPSTSSSPTKPPVRCLAARSHSRSQQEASPSLHSNGRSG